MGSVVPHFWGLAGMALGGLGWSWVMIFSKYTLDADVQALMASADGKR